MNNVSSIIEMLHETTADFSLPMGRRPPLREVFQRICSRLLRFIDADHSTITLLDEGRRFFRIEAEYPQLPQQLTGERIPIEDRATQSSLVVQQEPVVVGDLNNHALISESASFRQIAQTLDIRSLLIVPMVTDGQTIGTVSLDTMGRAKCFSKEEVQLCQTIANQLANFVEILRLRDEQEKYRRQAGLIALEPTQTVASSEARVTRILFQKLGKLIQFKKASLQLIVEGKRILVGAFGFDKSQPYTRLLRPVEEDPIIREIVHTQSAKILADTATAVYWQPHPRTADVHSWIGMPLVSQGETIGILTLDHDQAGFYAGTPEDVLARIEEWAAQAAHELRAARRLEVAKRQVQALEIVRQFAETVATKLDPQGVALTVVSVISKGLGCTRCSIFLAEPREQCESLVCMAACRGTSCKIGSKSVLPRPQPGHSPYPVYQAFQRGKSILIDDREQDPRFEYSHELYDGARSMIVVPLKVANQAIGAILAVDERPGWFSSADQLFLETLARQAASAIERDYGLKLVHSIGNQILGATEVDTVLKDVVSGAMKLTHTDSGVIYELNNNCSQVTHKFHPEGSIHPEPRLGDPKGITRTVITKKEMLEIPDIEKDSRVNPELRGRYRSMFAVPLVLDRSVVGVLYLNGKNVRELTETERSLLGTLAGQAALAIQRTRLYEKIRDSDAMYRSLVDHIPQFVFRKDKDSRFIWANASFCTSLGKSLEEIKGKNDFDFYPKEDAEKYIAGDRKAIETKQPLKFDEEHQPPGGGPKILVRVVKTPVLDSNGEVTGVQAIFWDITKEVEEKEGKEKKLAERWRLLAEQSPDGIVVHEGGKITLANPAAVRLFGADSADELKNRSILEFLDERSRPLAERRLVMLEEGQIVEPMLEMRVLRKNQEPVDVEVYSKYVPESGEIEEVFHDLTRTKTLLREMHHRVRRSFNQVNGFLTLQEGFTKNREDGHAFDALRERIQAMALVHTILYRTGRESDVEMEMYLRELKEALVTAHGSAEHVAVDFSAPGIILNEKQATACGLIVTELVSNSLQHAFPRENSPNQEPRVSVSLCSDQDMTQLEVSDNGIGMQPSSGAGESMGLSLVRSLVSDELKGQIHHSQAGASECGTTFTIKFPLTGKRRSVEDVK